MEPRLTLLCRWSLQSMPVDIYGDDYTDLTIIVPTRAANTSDYQSSDTYCHWQLKDFPDTVQDWLLKSFQTVVDTKGQLSMNMIYGQPLPKLQDGRDLWTLPCLVTTYKHQIEVVFCGYRAVHGDNIASGYGCRVIMDAYDTFNQAVRRCFEYRTPDNSLYVDYTTRYKLVMEGMLPQDATIKEGTNVQ